MAELQIEVVAGPGLNLLNGPFAGILREFVVRCAEQRRRVCNGRPANLLVLQHSVLRFGLKIMVSAVQFRPWAPCPKKPLT